MPRKKCIPPSFGYSAPYLAHISSSQNFALSPHLDGYLCPTGPFAAQNQEPNKYHQLDIKLYISSTQVAVI